LEVHGADGAPLPISGAKLRAVLAMLALDCGKVVATDRLVEGLWRDDPPAGVTNALQRMISKLRKALGSSDIVVMQPPGYVLNVDPDQVDALRFEAEVADGRAAAARGNLEAAVEWFQSAESLWRGPVLADFTFEEFAQPSIVRLQELRLGAAEERVDAELVLGRHDQLLDELERLVTVNPLRERLRGQLMLALYRADRQADALRTYRDAREVLAEELGLDPGPALQALETAILDQDPALVPLGLGVSIAPSRRSRTNLPAQRTPLIGREREVEELVGLVTQSRLVTLVGPGGAGKTRLAIESARAVIDQWRDGVLLVELAPVHDPIAVADAIAAVLDLPESDVDAATSVRRYCEDKALLLVLDNCEHLVDAAALITEDLLAACDEVHVLATSREALRVSGESVWPVPPLAAPDAIELFISRAVAVDPAFTADESTLQVIREIGQRLDGLPLAIELAAARTRAFSVPQIAERLDDRFRLLTGGPRTAMARQQTLRAVVQWSYDLLFEDERRAFERLSVLTGGFDIAAAEAVCADADIERADVVELVAGLVDKSLLFVDRSRFRPRFRMLQTLSQYGREQLVERGEADVVLRRAADHFAHLCAQGRSAFQGVEQRWWHHSMQGEQDNVRTVFEWTIGAEEKEIAVAIAGDVALHRWVTGAARDGFRWLDVALALPGEVSPFTRGWALIWHAFLGYLTGHHTEVDQTFGTGLRLLREHGDPVMTAYAMTFASQVVAEMGRPQEAAEINAAAVALIEPAGDGPWMKAVRTWLRAGLALQSAGDIKTFERLLREAQLQFRDAGDEFMTAICIDLVAELDEMIGDVESARILLREALDTAAALRMFRFEVALTARLGALAVQAGDLDEAAPMLETTLTRTIELSAEPVRAQALVAWADLQRRQGRLDGAERAALEALELYRNAGSRFSSLFSRGTSPLDVPGGLSAAASVLGFVAEARGDVTNASRWHRESYAHASAVAHPRGVPRALEGLAGAATLAGNTERAARLLGLADQLRSDQAAARTPSEQRDVDRAGAAAAAALGTTFAAAYEHGRQATVEELLDDGASALRKA
jgi:predicted ATPase/DNA-binding SARP family transcriptional activator